MLPQPSGRKEERVPSFLQEFRDQLPKKNSGGHAGVLPTSAVNGGKLRRKEKAEVVNPRKLPPPWPISSVRYDSHLLSVSEFHAPTI